MLSNAFYLSQKMGSGAKKIIGCYQAAKSAKKSAVGESEFRGGSSKFRGSKVSLTGAENF